MDSAQGVGIELGGDSSRVLPLCMGGVHASGDRDCVDPFLEWCEVPDDGSSWDP